MTETTCEVLFPGAKKLYAYRLDESFGLKVGDQARVEVRGALVKVDIIEIHSEPKEYPFPLKAIMGKWIEPGLDEDEYNDIHSGSI